MKNFLSFEVLHTEKKTAERHDSSSQAIQNRQRKVGLALSGLLASIGLLPGCAQNEPTPPTSPAQTQAAQDPQSRRNRIMGEYEEARGGLPADMKYSTERTNPPEISDVFLMVDETQSFLILQKEVLQARLDYLNNLLERVNEHASNGTNFSEAEIADVTTALQQLRESYLTPTSDSPTVSNAPAQTPAPANEAEAR